MFNLLEDKITMYLMCFGGGFGWCGSNEYVVEVSVIVHCMKVLVKLMWMCEDEFCYEWYREFLKGVYGYGFGGGVGLVCWVNVLVVVSVSPVVVKRCFMVFCFYECV